LQDNSKLTTLEGLANLQAVTGDILLLRNASLPTSLAQELVGRLVAAGFEGEVDVEGNMP
jgi:hypothetical protein